jgi:hypothetical protein
MRAMLDSIAASAVGCPSTVTMMSPGLRPAFAAGDPANTLVITRPCLLFSRAAPMPEYCPLCFSSKACVSFGERYTV